MARKKKIEPSPEEMLANQKESEIKKWEDKIYRIPEPTYFFKPGDVVSIRNRDNDIVDEVLWGGKAYGVIADFGDSKTYFVVPWANVKPPIYGNTNFAKNKDIRFYFSSMDLGTLISEYYDDGIDMDPNYQRGYVWNDDDKRDLIDSIFNNIDIGKFVLVRLPDEDYFSRHYGHEILDGKQRLNTIISFYEDRFTYKGKYYSQLSREDKKFFKRTVVEVAKVQNYDKETILKYFIMLNKTGKSMDKEHLKDVEKMLGQMQD